MDVIALREQARGNWSISAERQAPAILRHMVSITAEEFANVELVSNGVAVLNNGPDNPQPGAPDISVTPHEAMKDIRLAASFYSNGEGSTPVNSNGASWTNGSQEKAPGRIGRATSRFSPKRIFRIIYQPGIQKGPVAVSDRPFGSARSDIVREVWVP